MKLFNKSGIITMTIGWLLLFLNHHYSLAITTLIIVLLMVIINTIIKITSKKSAPKAPNPK